MSVSVNGTNGLTFSDGSSQATAWVPGMRNRIINGDFRIDQRNAGASVTPANGAYTLDRWLYQAYQAGKITLQQNQGSVTPPAGFKNYLGITSTSAYSVLTGEYFVLDQRIEGYNVADLAWGTSSASSVTLSFWARSSLTGTHGGALQNSSSTRSYPFSYTINSANTWEYKTVSIAGDTSGTWVTDNGIGLVVYFNVGTGATFSGTAGAWAGADYRSATGAQSIIGTNGATWMVTGVQLEKGSTATSFDYRPYGTELQLCQRYCYAQNKLVTNNYYAFGAGFATGATTGQLGTPFPVSMRSNPSVTYSAANLFFVDSAMSTNSAITSISADQVGNNYGFSNYGGATSGTTGGGGRWLANNAAAAWVIWSAEL